MPADSASEIVKFTISIPRELCTNVKAKYSSSVVPPDPSVHFYHWVTVYMLGLVLGLFSALLDMFRTRSPMFDTLQRRNNSHGLVFI